MEKERKKPEIKKRLVSILLVLSLFALMMVSCSHEGSENDPGDTSETVVTDSSDMTFAFGSTGVTFELGEMFPNLKGVIKKEYGIEIKEGSGIYLSDLQYCAMTKDKYEELIGSPALSEEDIAFAEQRIIDFILVYTIDGGRTMDELKDVLPLYGLPSSGLKEIGSVGEYGFYCIVNPLEHLIGTEIILDDGFSAEYADIIKAFEDTSFIKLSEPEKEVRADLGDIIQFKTVDLDGNVVDSSELFKKNKITMVNLWGTYCGPCIREMPDLEVLSSRIKEKGCSVIGIVVDVPSISNTSMVDTAKDILGDTGVTYLNLVPWFTIRDDLPAAFIPTTYFIDSEGHIIGEPAVGARGADEYEKLIDEAIAASEK